MITDIRLQNFRSYTDASFDLGAGVNIIVGPNASGKTNLLEALLVVARGNSYRVKDQELIGFDKPWARLDVHTPTGQRTVKIMSEPSSKTYEIDKKEFKRLSHQHTVPTVVFEPNHLALLTGSPELRRNYLDDLLEQTQPGYAATRRHYRRALAQRNALLKKGGKVVHQQVFPWDVRLSDLGGKIVRERAALAEDLAKKSPKLYKDLSRSKTKINLEYKPTCTIDNYESSLLKKLEANLTEDSIRGFTSVGPHREDLTVEFDGRPVSETASRGEVRTLTLALKILELDILKKARDINPLLLLDDVFSELDGVRRQALTDYVKKHQTFITTTDADTVLGHFTEASNIIPLG
jgi:DNA replication and repair protein RecF